MQVQMVCSNVPPSPVKQISAGNPILTISDVSLLLSYYTTKLSLLSQISHTRHGATQILNAGLFAAVRESKLFSTDPDLGLTIASSRPVETHYKLLVSFMRVINAVVLSKGQQNMQVMSTARKFLAENRSGILGVFKRDVRIGAESDTGRNVMVDGSLVDELVEAYMVLISISSFLEVSSLFLLPPSFRHSS